MISPKAFYEYLDSAGINFYAGVPDSLLKDFCGYVSDNVKGEQHIITSNEGGAIAIGIGHYLATGFPPLVYMQNSGFGNTINPLISLADPAVYSIPMILLIGWRGEPGVKDEPQHIKQGYVSEDLLNTLDIPYSILDSETDAYNLVKKAVRDSLDSSRPYAILVRKNTFSKYNMIDLNENKCSISREQAIEMVVDLINEDDIVVSTTGKISRELFEIRSKKKMGHFRDFLTVGGMGHANQIALGIALIKENRTIYCFDGDGAILMHTGSIGTIGQQTPSNMKHIVFNNGAHDSVGGQPTIGFDISFRNMANIFNYKSSFIIESVNEFKDIFSEFKLSKGPSFLEIKVNKGSRTDLGRPTIDPLNNRNDFMKFLNE
ncbi:phosphonopyruvate decarboxylase [Flavobacteriaceae bacterium]|nr:phosphonopyruvate decarboxylase [Flavobacteriaceae bacterium]